jgi:hypothetical protein
MGCECAGSTPLAIHVTGLPGLSQTIAPVPKRTDPDHDDTEEKLMDFFGCPFVKFQ